MSSEKESHFKGRASITWIKDYKDKLLFFFRACTDELFTIRPETWIKKVNWSHFDQHVDFNRRKKMNVYHCLITKYTALYMTTLRSLPIHKKECTCVRYHYRWALALQALGKRKIICGRRGTWESADSSLKDSHSDLSNTYCDRPTCFRLICCTHNL